LKSYAIATCKRVLRSVGEDEVARLVGYFGAEAKKHLDDDINDEAVTPYGNALSSRHNVAHKDGSNITFGELSAAIEAARKLIAIVSTTISLRIEARNCSDPTVLAVHGTWIPALPAGMTRWRLRGYEQIPPGSG